MIAIHRAVESCKAQGINVDDHFREVTKMIEIGKENLATEMTSYNVESKDLTGEQSITSEHVQNNKSVRNMLAQRNKAIIVE